MNFDDDDEIFSTSAVSDDDDVPPKKRKFLSGNTIWFLVSGVPLVIVFIFLLWLFPPNQLKKMNEVSRASNSVHGLQEMQAAANQQILTFWENFLQDTPTTEKAVVPMMDHQLYTALSGFGDALCSSKNGLCGFPRTMKNLTETIRTALHGPINLSCETQSSRLRFSFVCPHSGQAHYKIVNRNREHIMSADCQFTSADMVRASYTSPVKAVAHMHMNSDYKWVVRDISLNIENKIYTLDSKGVAVSTVPKKFASNI